MWVTSSTWRRGEHQDAGVLSGGRAKDDGVLCHALRESHDPPCSLPALRSRGTDHSANQRGIMLWEWQPVTSPGMGSSSVGTPSPLTVTIGGQVRMPSKWVQSPVWLF